MVNQSDRRQFVLHEILGLLRKNDKNYMLSDTIVRLISDTPSTAPYARLSSTKCGLTITYRDLKQGPKDGVYKGLRIEQFNTRIALTPSENYNSTWFQGKKSISLSASPFGYMSHFKFQGVTAFDTVLFKSTPQGDLAISKAIGSSDNVSSAFELTLRQKGILDATATLFNPKESIEALDDTSPVPLRVDLSCRVETENN